MSSSEHERFGDGGESAGSGALPFELAGPPGPTKHSRPSSGKRLWTYRKAAVLHPSNLIALAGILMLGLTHPSVDVVLFGLGVELFFVYLAPKSQWFRRCLDDGLEEAARAAAQRTRELLVARMADGHRDELTRIDCLIKKIHETEADRSESVALTEDLDLNGIAASYIRLALAYRACEEALNLGEQRPMRILIRSLEVAQNNASERVRRAIKERLSIAYQRAEHEANIRENLEVITHQLAALVDLVQLRHQKALTLGPSAEAARFMQDLEETRSAVREIGELDAGERVPMRSIAFA